MKQIAIVSGKGGTGKTTLAASFAALAGKAVVADCDVDAATLHLLLDPNVISQQEFKGSKLAVIDGSKCAKCGACEKACRFDAIVDLEVNPVLCEGCGVCAYVCPEGAIRLEERVSGYAYISETRYGPMSHARLLAAQANSGKLVALVRRNAEVLAKRHNLELVLIDGPPGIGCPVIASLTGVDLVVAVTEPTISGYRDLDRALDLARHFGIKSSVVVNMHDINVENAEKIIESCGKGGVEILAKIPFDPTVTEAMVAGKPVVEHSPDCAASIVISRAWFRVCGILGIGAHPCEAPSTQA
ncbi:MAG: ATP-binding protein [Candidatus Brockarchaeota archaeon]|nr:ATP-binding protein [Candidatus Brockarchaeota archaeon]